MRSNQHLAVTTVYTVIRTTVDIVVKPVLEAEIFIHYVKTIRLLYRLTPGSLWCAWQSHRTDPTNQSAPKYRCSKHLAITRWSLQRIYINQNCLVKLQVTHQHLRSPESHYVVLAVVEDKDIVIKLCCCNKHRAINQKCFSTGKIKQGKALRAQYYSVAFFLKVNIWFGSRTVKSVECLPFPQVSFLHLKTTLKVSLHKHRVAFWAVRQQLHTSPHLYEMLTCML